MIVTRQFNCEPGAVTAARVMVHDALAPWPRQVVETVELVASELATNAVRHARTGFEMTIEANEEIRVEVTDRGAGRPTPVSPEPRDLTGRGLRIVEALSDAWGVTVRPEGKTVWCTLRPTVGGLSSEATTGIEPV